MRRDRGGGRSIGELLPEVFRRGGLVRGVRRAEAVLLWPRIVGHEVARFSTAVALTNGVLVVDVPDPETALHLGMHRHHVLAAYRDRLGRDLVRELRFRVGRPDTPPEAPPAERPHPVDPEAMAGLARAVAGLDDAVAKPALQAGRALLALRARRVAAGWTPCPVCGVPAEPPEGPPELRPTPAPADDDPRGWCATCRRHAGSQRVRAASARLAQDPTSACPELTEEERAIAGRFALRSVCDGALALLPIVLGDPSRLGDLSAAVRTAATLAHGRGDVDDETLELLRGTVDDRVLRVVAGAARRAP